MQGIAVIENAKVLNLVEKKNDDGEVALAEVLDSVKSKENGAEASIDFKKASQDELHAYMAEVLPTYDRDRVHASDIKKLIQWYNILVKNGITEFVSAEEETVEE